MATSSSTEASEFTRLLRREGDCLVWIGEYSYDRKGVRIGRWTWQGRRETLGRAAWRIIGGAPVPEGKVVRHRCGNQLCVRHVAVAIRGRRAAATVRAVATRRYNARLPEARVDEALALAAGGLSSREVAAAVGVSNSTAWAIITGRSWADRGEGQGRGKKRPSI